MLAFRLLGPFEVRSPRGELVLPPRRKQRELLGMLVLRAGAVVDADEIVEALWGARPPVSARANLSSYVSGLRTVLAAVTPGESARLRWVAGGYQLDLPPDGCDLPVFERLVAEGRRAGADGRPDRAAALLADALGLWRGPALQGLGEHQWLLPVRTRLEEARLAAIEDEAGARLRLGQHRELVGELSALSAAHPLRERLTGLHMQALGGAGRRAEALRVYNDAAEVLQAELGVEPGPQLRRLHRQLRTADGRPPGAGSTRAPGLRPVPALLPADTADFSGRAGEVRRIEELLLAPAVAPTVVGVSGMAGVGKSALGVHLAHRVSGHYPDGQLYADLAGARPVPADPADVLGRFLRALGVDGRAVPRSLADRSALYRSHLAGRRVLVVLDDAATADQVRPLLPGSPTCSMLVTGRRRLGAVEGALRVSLEELSVADAVRMLARVVDDDRVARQPEEAERLVRLCGRLPLALRIAGAKLAGRPDWPLSRMVTLLGDEQRRLDRLTAGDLQVRASFTLSDRGLDDTARRLLRGLSLFDVPDFPDLLATAVLQGPVDEAAESLESLVDARLLSVARVDAAGQVRYRFHDLVRLHVREQADPVDVAVLDRGFGMWLGLAERMAADVPGPCYAPLLGSGPRTSVAPPVVDPLRWFDAERHALTAAAHQAARLDHAEVAYGLVGSLEKYFDLRGMYGEWVAVGTAALDACRRTGNRLGEAVMIRGLLDVRAWVDAEDVDPAGGPAALLQRFEALDCRAGMSDAAVMCSWERTAEGRQAEAVELALRALRYADEADHVGGRARAHAAAAVALRDQRRLGEATGHLVAALRAARALGNPRYEATVLQYLGIVQGEQGELATAERTLFDSLEITRQYADDFSEALTLLALARVHAGLGDPARAEVEAESALALGREYRMPHHVADSLTVLGELALAGGRAADAVALIEESVSIWRDRGWLSFLAGALTSLGRARIVLDPPAARESWQEARRLYDRLGDAGRGADVEQLLRTV